MVFREEQLLRVSVGVSGGDGVWGGWDEAILQNANVFHGQ